MSTIVVPVVTDAIPLPVYDPAAVSPYTGSVTISVTPSHPEEATD